MKLAYTAHQNAYLSIKLANPYSQQKPNSLEKAQPLAAWRSLAENLYALAVGGIMGNVRPHFAVIRILEKLTDGP